MANEKNKNKPADVPAPVAPAPVVTAGGLTDDEVRAAYAKIQAGRATAKARRETPEAKAKAKAQREKESAKRAAVLARIAELEGSK